MPYRLALGLAAPLLVWQGRQARQRIVRLPEPTGPRAHRAGSGPVLRVLVLGDSAAAGVGVDTVAEALSGQLTAQLATTRTVHCHTLAKTGWTLADTLHALQDAPPSVAGLADVVLLSVGVNDVTALTPLHRWRRDYLRLLEHVQWHQRAQWVLCTAVPPMHRFLALPQPLRWVMGQRARHMNRVLAQLLRNHPTARLLQPDLPMRPESLAVDGFHPSAASYRLWARAAADAIAPTQAPDARH